MKNYKILSTESITQVIPDLWRLRFLWLLDFLERFLDFQNNRWWDISNYRFLYHWLLINFFLYYYWGRGWGFVDMLEGRFYSFIPSSNNLPVIQFFFDRWVCDDNRITIFTNYCGRLYNVLCHFISLKNHCNFYKIKVFLDLR